MLLWELLAVLGVFLLGSLFGGAVEFHQHCEHCLCESCKEYRRDLVRRVGARAARRGR